MDTYNKQNPILLKTFYNKLDKNLLEIVQVLISAE